MSQKHGCQGGFITDGGMRETVVVCDADGHFELGEFPVKTRIHIKANCKDNASLLLPVS